MIRNASTHSHLHPPQSSLAPDQTAPIAFPIAPPATRRSVSPDNLISHPPFIITLRRDISRRPGRVPSPLRRPNRRLAYRTGLHPEPAPPASSEIRSSITALRSEPALAHSLTHRPPARSADQHPCQHPTRPTSSATAALLMPWLP
ncbi:hypothetical protein PCL_08490 [Purpureocillium lilacinum]|uniref:Uncharacterized protein n=1 Tax=Purpureocillium lilacinum TaxID=33203 RepID=A0A2U3DRH7_PURLI|nr:hypothetical protein Purlil1_5475 [Purpureocillium lilacinum]PWI64857.1 hypothetical protein PCL_08490 [Purpureocillium lilacinum]